jgi:TolB-like protein/DNA-binding winged helix-turn-helix (wHTH) protein/Tfp pilus assembly protein PilF
VPACIHKFGEFELDPSRFELRRNGRVLKLERIPMELLLLLAEKDGSVVTRQEIVERLWGKDVFVDTEHGINTAIRKIRQALRDDPDQPRFIETVTGKGYRFVAEKNGDSSSAAPAAAAPTAPAEAAAPIPPAEPAAIPADVPLAAPKRRFLTAAALLLLLVLAGTLVAVNSAGMRDRLFPSSRARQIHSLAVLPLANLSGDASQDYFADGMTDEVITMLAKNTSLRVVSRTSAMQYKDARRPVRDIARELGVDGILEGSIERSSHRVHMTVQLIYAPTDTHVWAESYDRDLDQAFSLPSDLSQTIAKAVQVATSPARPPRYINPDAHDAYLRGRYLWFTFNIEQTLPYFEKALQLQPDYAAAWSGLADTYMLAGMGFRPPQQVTMKALEAARKAVELDDSLPEAHNSIAAWYLFYGWDPTRADAEAKRALDLRPNFAEAHYVRHYVLMALNRQDEAQVEEKRAVELDPFTRSWGLGSFYIQTRQYDSAINELRLQQVARPNDAEVLMNLSEAYWLKGMYKESQQTLEEALRLQHQPELAAAARQAWLQGGETAVEKWGVEQAKSRARKGYVSSLDMSTAFAFTGDKEQTLKYLEAAYREHVPDLIKVQNEPLFDFLHHEPRYQALIKQIGLPPAQ